MLLIQYTILRRPFAIYWTSYGGGPSLPSIKLICANDDYCNHYESPLGKNRLQSNASYLGDEPGTHLLNPDISTTMNR